MAVRRVIFERLRVFLPSVGVIPAGELAKALLPMEVSLVRSAQLMEVSAGQLLKASVGMAERLGWRVIWVSAEPKTCLVQEAGARCGRAERSTTVGEAELKIKAPGPMDRRAGRVERLRVVMPVFLKASRPMDWRVVFVSKVSVFRPALSAKASLPMAMVLEGIVREANVGEEGAKAFLKEASLMVREAALGRVSCCSCL
jgi:hypothetical protein